MVYWCWTLPLSLLHAATSAFSAWTKTCSDPRRCEQTSQSLYNVCVHVSGNRPAAVVILPSHLANDFEDFCRSNPAPLPLLYRSQPVTRHSDVRYSYTPHAVQASHRLSQTLTLYSVWICYRIHCISPTVCLSSGQMSLSTVCMRRVAWWKLCLICRVTPGKQGILKQCRTTPTPQITGRTPQGLDLTLGSQQFHRSFLLLLSELNQSSRTWCVSIWAATLASRTACRKQASLSGTSARIGYATNIC